MLRRFDPGIATTDDAHRRLRDHEVNVIGGQHARNIVVLNRAVLDGRLNNSLGIRDALLKAIERGEVLHGRLSNDDVLHQADSKPAGCGLCTAAPSCRYIMRSTFTVPGQRAAWVVTLAAAAILMVTMGARQTLGLFISP